MLMLLLLLLLLIIIKEADIDVLTNVLCSSSYCIFFIYIYGDKHLFPCKCPSKRCGFFFQEIRHNMTVNLTTLRVWCYACTKEVFLERKLGPHTQLPSAAKLISPVQTPSPVRTLMQLSVDAKQSLKVWLCLDKIFLHI